MTHQDASNPSPKTPWLLLRAMAVLLLVASTGLTAWSAPLPAAVQAGGQLLYSLGSDATVTLGYGSSLGGIDRQRGAL